MRLYVLVTVIPVENFCPKFHLLFNPQIFPKITWSENLHCGGSGASGVPWTSRFLERVNAVSLFRSVLLGPKYILCSSRFVHSTRNPKERRPRSLLLPVVPIFSGLLSLRILPSLLILESNEWQIRYGRRSNRSGRRRTNVEFRCLDLNYFDVCYHDSTDSAGLVAELSVGPVSALSSLSLGVRFFRQSRTRKVREFIPNKAK